MANVDVFNPHIGYSAAFGFNPNWNYGVARKIGQNYATARPRFGAWSTRSIGDAGYSFDLTFVDRPIQQVNYIRNFYEQFQRGFFTLVDYDNFAREHVGRFTAYSDDTHTANLRYTIRCTFEEIPGCAMRNYPSNWQQWGQWLQVADDWMNPLVNYSSQAANAWVLQQSPDAVAQGISASIPRGYELFNATPQGVDFAQMEYQGWGFRMNFRIANTLGMCTVYLDGVSVAVVDLSAGTTAGGASTVVPFASVQNGVLTLTADNVPLGRHRVKVQAMQEAGSQSANGAYGVIFPAMQVMN